MSDVVFTPRVFDMMTGVLSAGGKFASRPDSPAKLEAGFTSFPNIKAFVVYCDFSIRNPEPTYEKNCKLDPNILIMNYSLSFLITVISTNSSTLGVENPAQSGSESTTLTIIV